MAVFAAMVLGALGVLGALAVLGSRGAAADEAGARAAAKAAAKAAARAECDRLAAVPYADARNDPGVPFNVIVAFPALSVCGNAWQDPAAPPPPRIIYLIARLAHRDGEKEDAKGLYKLALDKGYQMAGYALGRLSLAAYRRDRIDVESLREAYRLFLTGAEAGERHSQNALAGLLALETPFKDEAAALAWRRRAVDAGLPAAHYAMGRWHETGRLVDQDMAKALAHMETATRHHYPAAFGRLAYYYDTGMGVGRDKEKAVALYRQGAARGDVFSHEMLAEKYRKGEDLPQDFEAMREHLEKADYGGSETALATLAAVSIRIKNVEDAVYYARLAVERGHMDAFDSLLTAYCMYYCPEDDLPNALNVADTRTEAERRKGARSAILFLSEFMEDNKRAVKDGAATLGMYFRGGMRGAIPVDKVKARYWYERAVAFGNKEARKALAEMDGE